MSELTCEQVQQYDRQIRLWGVTGQARISSSRIIIIGIDACTAEICKDLAAAGINITLIDSRAFKSIACTLPIPPAEDGEPEEDFTDSNSSTVSAVFGGRLRRFNRFITVDNATVDTVEFRGAACVVVAGVLTNLAQTVIWESNARRQEVPFVLVVGTPDLAVALFSDLQVPERVALITEILQNKEKTGLAVEAHLGDVARTLENSENKEVPPAVASILGGVIAQEIRKRISDHTYGAWNVCAFSFPDSAMVVGAVASAQQDTRGKSVTADIADAVSVSDDD